MIKVIRSGKEMNVFSQKSKERGQSIGFVPTMGFLHEGHLSLVEAARQQCDLVVVSIFVNPIQFSPGEDQDRYPRNLAHDKELLKNLSPLIIFHPQTSEMYPDGFKTYVKVEELGDKLCGKFRPGHFKGVTTVVAKLFNIVLPDMVFLGEKDFQQQLIIKQMVRDLNYNIKVHILPTIREFDGLAMSSRNSYLSLKERETATVLYKTLCRARKMIIDGETDLRKIHLTISRQLGMEPSVRVEYISMVDPETLQEVRELRGPLMIALAVRIGKARLIDNIIIH